MQSPPIKRQQQQSNKATQTANKRKEKTVKPTNRRPPLLFFLIFNKRANQLQLVCDQIWDGEPNPRKLKKDTVLLSKTGLAMVSTRHSPSTRRKYKAWKTLAINISQPRAKYIILARIRSQLVWMQGAFLLHNSMSLMRRNAFHQLLLTYRKAMTFQTLPRQGSLLKRRRSRTSMTTTMDHRIDGEHWIDGHWKAFKMTTN